MISNMDTIISITGQIRDNLKSNVKPKEDDVFNLISEIKQLEGIVSKDLIRAFTEETISFLIEGNEPDYSKTREYINTVDTEISFIAGMFNSPYNPLFGFECILYKKHEVNSSITSHYPSSVVLPVTVLGCTDGFKETMNVSLFPEFFVASAPIKNEHKVFYFTNRFEKRNHLITKPILNQLTTASTFKVLKSASDEEIQEACIAWVYLHEYHHRTGVLPIPEYLNIKGSRAAASLEELRVDLHSIIACIDLYINKKLEKGLLFAELIFAERLLRYPIQIDPHINFDSRASQFFYSFLNDVGTKVFDGTEIHIDVIELREELEKIVNYIDMFERQISRLETAEAKKQIDNLSKSLGGFSVETNKYERLPLYQTMINICENTSIETLISH
ncbi:DUF6421 family protein [Lysinibacillus sp. NPDC097231]|uniref:DUF6421 family protein n=1 Tax=Lysinibacillus sp. NPDC097231 TaxID=3364142 RepID=UPI00381FD81C